jgi:AcrR family transcriptional regulator
MKIANNRTLYIVRTVVLKSMNQKVDESQTAALTDLRVIRTRELLRNALLTLLEQKPLDQIVVRDITTAARIGYATFYRHYQTKEALLDDLARDQVDQLVGMALPVMDSVNTLAAYTTLFTYVNEHRLLWTTLLTGGAASAIKQELLRVSRETAAARTAPEKWRTTELSVILVVTCTVELLAWWLSQPDPMTVEEVARIFDETIILPLMKRNG